MTLLQTLGSNIREIRKAKGISQFGLALLSGVNKNYLSDLERGRRNPTVAVLERIALALGVDVSTLFIRKEE